MYRIDLFFRWVLVMTYLAMAGALAFVPAPDLATWSRIMFTVMAFIGFILSFVDAVERTKKARKP